MSQAGYMLQYIGGTNEIQQLRHETIPRTKLLPILPLVHPPTLVLQSDLFCFPRYVVHRSWSALGATGHIESLGTHSINAPVFGTNVFPPVLVLDGDPASIADPLVVPLCGSLLGPKGLPQVQHLSPVVMVQVTEESRLVPVRVVTLWARVN